MAAELSRANANNMPRVPIRVMMPAACALSLAIVLIVRKYFQDVGGE